jgi:hypothetical protein
MSRAGPYVNATADLAYSLKPCFSGPHRSARVAERNATAAVIGAGDYIGAAIARRFAAEGFTVFAGRRNGDKLAPLVADIEGAGGRVVARSLDARKKKKSSHSLLMPSGTHRSKSASSTSARM